MKAKLGHYVQWLREGFLQMLRLHPVEAGLIALGCIGCLVAYVTDSDDTLAGWRSCRWPSLLRWPS